MTDQTPPPHRPKNREDTRAAILQAAKDLLANSGFSAFGINALARHSGFDKQLVYRYFGGMDGLIDAIGDDLANWIEGRLAGLAALPAFASYGALVTAVISAYIDALRADPLMQKLVAWELSETSPHLRRMSDQRARQLALWVARMRGPLQPREGTDAPALNAVLLAAAQHLVLSSSVAGQFIGVPLTDDLHWNRIKAMVARIVTAIHGD